MYVMWYEQAYSITKLRILAVVVYGPRKLYNVNCSQP